MATRLIEPRTGLRGVRASRDLALQVIGQLVEMEQEYFEPRADVTAGSCSAAGCRRAGRARKRRRRPRRSRDAARRPSSPLRDARIHGGRAIAAGGQRGPPAPPLGAVGREGERLQGPEAARAHAGVLAAAARGGARRRGAARRRLRVRKRRLRRARRRRGHPARRRLRARDRARARLRRRARPLGRRAGRRRRGPGRSPPGGERHRGRAGRGRHRAADQRPAAARRAPGQPARRSPFRCHTTAASSRSPRRCRPACPRRARARSALTWPGRRRACGWRSSRAPCWR